MRETVEVGQYRLTPWGSVYQVTDKSWGDKWKVRLIDSPWAAPDWAEKYILSDRLLTEIEVLLYE